MHKAIVIFPNLINEKPVRKCEYCGKYFLHFKKGNPPKTCSNECRKKYRYDYINNHKKQNKKHKKHNSKNIIRETITNKGYLPDGWNQDDTLYDLGESHLKEHTFNDSDKEMKAIQKEMKRLRLK